MAYNKKYKFKDIDALVYIAGGYFCGNDTRYKHYIIRFLSYFLVGLRCIIAKKPYGIFALEVGRVKCRWLRWVEKTILKKAEIVIVRNKESLDVLADYDIYNAILTADAVFAMENSLFIDKSLNEEISACNNKKLFLHISSSAHVNEKIIEKVIPGLNKFLEKHQEYAVVIGLDQSPQSQKEIIELVAEKIKCQKIIYNYFNDPVDLCKVLDAMDCIITTKLHVGIVGAKLSKPVISFSGRTEKIGEKHLIPLLGVWEKAEDIDFDALPNEFVLKCNHDSGSVIICKDKASFDKEAAITKLNKKLKRNMFYWSREWPYKNIERKIICEKFMQDQNFDVLNVYKILNFNNGDQIIQVIQDDKTEKESIDYFDTLWNRLDLRQNYPNSENPLPEPKTLDTMLGFAKELSEGFPFLRTDFYEINGKVYFSEFTFFQMLVWANLHRSIGKRI